MKRELKPELVVSTAEALSRRVSERFPGSGLSRLAGEVVIAAREAGPAAEELSRPYWPLRLAILSLTLVLMLGLPALLLQLKVGMGSPGMAEFLQGADAAVNLLLLLGAGIVWLTRLEERRKRRRALERVHALRELAHVADMHQLTKTPETVAALPGTASSPKRAMSRAELARYLDYCTELLAVIGKVAATYGRREQDGVVLEAVDDVESLTTGLARKVWQKIAVLESSARG